MHQLLQASTSASATSRCFMPEPRSAGPVDSTVGMTSFVPGRIAEIEIRVVLAQQPDRDVVALLSENPDGLAGA